MDVSTAEEPSSGGAPGSAPSPQSEAVTNELQELSLQPAPNLPPIRERKNVLQLKLQQRRTREELASQGIMPPLKSPAAFHEQRRSLERARTEDYLKRKIRSRPERAELVRMHILEETSAEPSLQAKQLQLKRARLADDLNDKISHRPGPMELIHKNILPVHSSLKQVLIETDFPKVENSSFDEDSSDALSPDQPASHDSPLGPAPLPSPSDARASSVPSPSQFLSQVPPPPPPPPPPPLPPTSVPSPPQKLTNGTAAQRPTPGLVKQAQAKPASERPPHRPKKPKDSKPKVKKLKYHQYIPPDQKAEREPPPPLDSTYAKILQQQQLFLQLQILNQQQQHYNYHAILPAPPKPLTEQQPSSNNGPSPSRAVPAPTSTPSSQSGPSRQSSVGGAKPGALPPNLDELKVAELKHELKLRSLPVSGTKNDLIERLRTYQEQSGGGSSTPTPACPGGTAPPKGPPSQPAPPAAALRPPADAAVMMAAFPFVATVGGAPAPIMHFGSTNSSPPASPAPSERSLAGMSADETSCNGDAFGEMVSSPLTQLSLHPTAIKEEAPGSAPAPCCFSRPAVRPAPAPLATAPPALDKDQMLQAKDKQIEKLTRMLLQKQQLVETLRSQLEGQRGAGGGGCEAAGPVRVKEEPPDTPSPGDPFGPLSPGTADAEAVRVTIKEEAEEEEEENMACPETPQALRSLQPQLEQMQAHLQLERLRLQQAQRVKAQQQALQQLVLQQNQQNQQRRAQQRKKKSQKHQQQQQALAQQQQQRLQSHQVFINQHPGSAPSFPLDLLKSHPAPTLVTDSNGNHFLIALTNHNTESQGSNSPQNKSVNHIKLQRLQSTPSKLPSQSTPQIPSTDTQSKQPTQAGVANQSNRKGQKPGLQVSTNHAQTAVTSVSAPPNLQPFFPSGDCTPSSNHTPSPGELCPGLDQHALFSPPSPKCSPSSPPEKENGSTQHMDDLFDILIQTGEISAGFKPAPDPALSRLRPNTPLPPVSQSPSPLQLSPPTPPEPGTPRVDPGTPVPDAPPAAGGGRLEDFLESTTGKPLLGAEPGGPLTLIDDLHSQMLSTSSILDHTATPMDTYELGGYTPHHPGLDFGESALDSMDWLDITMGGGGGEGPGLASLGPSAPSSVFSADFLDSSDLQLHWDSCL